MPASWCAQTRSITTPKDLEGKKVGVRAYSVTTGVWLRQMLMDDFGVDNSKITWVVDDEEHVQELKLPGNVIHAPEGSSLADMMASGELQAGVEAAAGIGRTGAPTGGWQEVEANYPDLLPNAVELEADFFHRTGVYPMHGTIVVKDRVLEQHPWVAKSLFDAFSRAKDEWLEKVRAEGPQNATEKKYMKLTEIVGPDPFALWHRGKSRDDRGAGEDRVRAGPDAQEDEHGRAVRRSRPRCPRWPDARPIETLTMIIDCHGHYTTVPKRFRDWRAAQVAAANEPASAPPLRRRAADRRRDPRGHRGRPAQAPAGARRRPDAVLADRRV